MIAHAFPPTLGGVESHLLDLCLVLLRKGVDVHCLVGGEQQSQEATSGIELRREPSLRPSQLILRSGLRLSSHSHEPEPNALKEVVCSVIDEVNPDIIHVHNGHHYGGELAEAVLDASKAHSVNTVHDHLGEYVVPSVLELNWDHVIYVSEHVKGRLPTSRPNQVLRLGIDLDRFRPASDTKSQAIHSDPFRGYPRPIIFHPARLLPWKGVDVSIKAFAELLETIECGTLVLCGSSDIVSEAADTLEVRREAEELAATLGVSTSIVFRDFTPAQMPYAYRASDVVIYPTSGDEPLGLVPLEAMACGKPVIATRSGGMLETIADARTGMLIPKADAVALKVALLRVLTDHSLRRLLERSGRSYVNANHDLETYCDQILTIYRDRVGGSGASTK